MYIERQQYIDALMAKRWNGKVKIITGIRRCGKSFLLSTLYKEKLMAEGVEEDQFVEIALDKKAFIAYRNPNLLYDYVLEHTKDADRQYYVMIDEIQLSYKVKNTDIDESLVPEEDREMLYTTFYDILNDLMGRKNIDVYVTGSNSKMRSTDVVTNFRDRGSEIRVCPLSFGEFVAHTKLEKVDALEQYMLYGGMPYMIQLKTDKQKKDYLDNLFKEVYIKDIVEREKIEREDILSEVQSRH